MGIQSALDVFADLWGPPEKEEAAAARTRNGSESTKEIIPFKKDTPTLPASQAEVSVLDLALPVTFFPDVKASSLRRERLTLRELEGRIKAAKAERKDGLPLLKLARFGDRAKPSKDGKPGFCLRWDDNLQSVSGIEGDYDAGEVPMERAADMLRAAGVAALFYTSTHHAPDAPRWRVICPLQREVTRQEREALCARLNGALGGILGEESFKPSQSYYFGEAAMRDAKKGGGKAHPLQTLLVDGAALDTVPNLRPIYARPKADDVFGDLMGGTERKGQGKCGKPWATVVSALMAIPNDGAPNWPRFCEIVMAVHEESNGSPEGFEALVKWAAQNPSFSLRECQTIWRSLRAGQAGNIGGGLLFKQASEHGWSEPIPDDEFEDLGDEPEAQAPKTDTPARLSFLSPADCEAAPARSYLIKGLIAERDVGCIVGAPGAGKSLLAPFLAYAVAQGRNAFGMRCKAGKAFYVAAEDPRGMRGRVKALRMAHGDAQGFVLVEGVSDLLAKDSPDLVALKRALKEQRPQLVIIDTLAMAFPGLEENSAEAMGRVVSVARSLTKWGAAVVLVHHDTKDGQQGLPRGHSILNGALDVALHVKRDEAGVIRGKLTKNRNGTCERDIAFRIATEDGGKDEDGDAITLPRCAELANAEAAPQVRLNRSEKAVMMHFHELAKDGCDVEERALRQACIEGRNVSSADNPDSRRRTLDNALRGLLDKGALDYRGGCYALPDPDSFDDLSDFDDLSENPEKGGNFPEISGRQSGGNSENPENPL